jgi:hypothetical protein
MPKTMSTNENRSDKETTRNVTSNETESKGGNSLIVKPRRLGNWGFESVFIKKKQGNHRKL